MGRWVVAGGVEVGIVMVAVMVGRVGRPFGIETGLLLVVVGRVGWLRRWFGRRRMGGRRWFAARVMRLRRTCWMVFWVC